MESSSSSSSSSSLPLLLLFLLVSSVLYAESSSPHTKPFIQCLNTEDSTESTTPISQLTFTPKDPSYTPILDFNLQGLRFASPSYIKPAVIVTPVHESQIRTVLHCAKQHKIQVRTRCGGHDFEGVSFSSRSTIPFVMIDMINLRTIDVDAASETAWIQGGASLGEVYYRIAEKTTTHGFPGGVWSTVGISGFISGGGYGTLLRKYGLGADNVIDARIMVANGTILDKESMGEDLFWAIRGGIASNFGVVIAWKVKLVQVPEIVTVFAVQRTLEQDGTALLHKYQSVAPTTDRDLYIRTQFIATTINGTRTIQISFESLFLGGADRLLSIMNKDFPELGLVREDCMEMKWIKSALFFAGNAAFPWGDNIQVMLNRSVPPKLYSKAKSDYVRVPIPIQGLEGIWKIFLEQADFGLNIMMTPYGGIMEDYSESATPFPNRAGTMYMMFVGATWQADTTREELNKRLEDLDSLYAYLGDYVSKNPRRAYVNYNDLDIGAGTSYEEASTTWGLRYFKDNFRKLVEVKTSVDPDNFFLHEQSIPTFTIKSAVLDGRDEL